MDLLHEVRAKKRSSAASRAAPRLYRHGCSAVGQIEAGWSHLRKQAPDMAHAEAVMRLGLLQKALRKRLLGAIRWPIRLNRKDPHWARLDFAELDAMAESLWTATESD